MKANALRATLEKDVDAKKKSSEPEIKARQAAFVKDAACQMETWGDRPAQACELQRSQL